MIETPEMTFRAAEPYALLARSFEFMGRKIKTKFRFNVTGLC